MIVLPKNYSLNFLCKHLINTVEGRISMSSLWWFPVGNNLYLRWYSMAQSGLSRLVQRRQELCLHCHASDICKYTLGQIQLIQNRVCWFPTSQSVTMFWFVCSSWSSELRVQAPAASSRCSNMRSLRPCKANVIPSLTTYDNIILKILKIKIVQKDKESQQMLQYVAIQTGQSLKLRKDCLRDCALEVLDCNLPR